ncbi:hypothetical protein FHT08_003715 [Xanthomonas campestris]|uniref:HNH endonuclease signature motif containing protein n=1 Tax=Xanthomonas sp. CFBP 8151 TaxID=3035310 RepID=UPI00141B4757|nr:HNH endonuclease signature motif containing protein [Xanthomonas sp. CFBP 8151]NIJ78581.1 hypothetical protein [Xanthomonas sp. CFBP 8151]
MALNNSGETVTRLAPKPAVLRKLYLLSGNRCCFTGCDKPMVDADGDFIGEVCHIEAAEAGGQRFNPARTNEQNREISNLMLMCPTHHKKTNNIKQFTVSVLADIKNKHEAKFTDIGGRIASSINDSTDGNEVVPATNLKRFNRVLHQHVNPPELEESVKTLLAYAKQLERVPEPTRNFLGAVAERIYKVKDTGAVREEWGKYMIAVADIQQALSLRPEEIRANCTLLESYGLGSLDDTADWPAPCVVILYPAEGWSLWIDLAAFAKAEKIDFDTFWRDLDFSSLDE